MKKIIIPASKVCQGDLTLYTTSIKVRDLISENFYSIEQLDPASKKDKGYQRILNQSRAKKLADYIVRGQDEKDVFLPTSIFLATDKDIAFNEESNIIEIIISDVCPFSVVDGQHRLEGLRLAANKDERVLDFEVPVNIAIKLDKIAQMCHFLIVNTTQKSVDKSVEQNIIARLTNMVDTENVPSLPRWIMNRVESKEEDKALRYVEYLNEADDSPWLNKIKIANARNSKGKTINQRSFVDAIIKYVLSVNNPLIDITGNDIEKQKIIFLNYWKAIANILDDEKDTVLYKYNGVNLFCQFSSEFFRKLDDEGNFKVETMEKLLRECFQNVEDRYIKVGYPEYWHSGNDASNHNRSGVSHLCTAMIKALRTKKIDRDIEL